MSKKTPQDFEKQMQRLQIIVQELEKGEISLERNVALYKEGRTLAASCRHLLEKARHEILLCDQDGCREFSPAPNDAEEDA